MENPIAFSTLACPAWDIATVLTRAAEYGYNGLEWRGGDHGHIQPGMSSAKKTLLRQMSADKGLTAIAITAYTSFVSDDAGVRQANVAELCRYADLAAELGAQCVRAFVGELPSGVDPATTYERVTACLATAAEYAHGQGVRIALEPHDDFVRSLAIAPILRAVPHPALGVIWDVGNAYSAGENPTESYELLHERLSYVQVKDGLGRGIAWQLTALGKGDVPLRQAFELLARDKYAGPISVEWEYAWHPELDPPEVALPQAISLVRGLWAEAQSTRVSVSA
ncbi:MAG: sugar phosphate isomerase/epimerase family protein [Anaerolineales bacterium]